MNQALTEGEFVFKRRGIRIILGIVVAFLILSVGTMSSFIFFWQARNGYNIVDSNIKPSPDATLAYPLLDQEPISWQVPIAKTEISHLYLTAVFAAVVTLLLIWLVIIYAKAKDKYIVQNSKLIIDPEHYLRQNSFALGGFGSAIGVFGLLQTYFSSNSTQTVGYTGSVMLILLGISYLLFTRVSRSHLKNIYILIIILGILVLLSEIIFTQRINPVSILLSVVYYSILIRRLVNLPTKYL